MNASLEGGGAKASAAFFLAHRLWRCSGTGGAGGAAGFEIHLGGLELASGYDELTDAAEQGERFADDNGQRQALEVDRLL
ncbi:hypothetical protein [Salinicola peritrichatus]|uniref:hypothetical protein n=1 Tax=Salinicola peritrichatus TaxID=1267424 RepID=UPI0019550BFB